LLENESYPDAYWGSFDLLWRSMAVQSRVEGTTPEEARVLVEANNSSLIQAWMGLAHEINETRARVQSPLWGPLLKVEVDFVRGLNTYEVFRKQADILDAVHSRAAIAEVWLELEQVRDLEPPRRAGLNLVKVEEAVAHSME